MTSNPKQPQPFSWQPQLAWLAILGLSLLTVICLVASLGKVLNILFPAAAVAVGLFLYLRYPILYNGFTWWLFFMTPLIRRLADWRSGFTDPSPILLAPPLVASIAIVTLHRNLPKVRQQGSVPFVFSALGVLYGLAIGSIQGAPAPAIVSTLIWASPILFGFHLFSSWPDYPHYRQNIQRTFQWGLLVTAAYGIFQYVVAPEWDRLWLIETKLFTSMGSPEPFGLRVWSTMNSPLNFATVVLPATMLLFTSRGSLRLPGLIMGILTLLLTSVRTVWLGWALALITLILSLKGLLQIRLVSFVLTIILCVSPLITLEPFSQVIQARLTSLADLGEDRSAQDRQELYGRTLDLALSEVVGKGNGTLQPIDSGIIELLLTLGWFGAIPYVGGLSLLLVTLFRGFQSGGDVFIQTAFAIVAGFLPMLIGSNVIIGISGMVFWSFLSIGLAGIKYHQHHRHFKVT